MVELYLKLHVAYDTPQGLFFANLVDYYNDAELKCTGKGTTMSAAIRDLLRVLDKYERIDLTKYIPS